MGTKYINKDEIKIIHLELTSLCNARCPQCARTTALEQGILPLSSLSLEEIKNFFAPSFLSQIRYLYSCGNLGDPIMSEALLPAYDYFRSCGVGRLSLNTNGSVCSAAWWSDLAKTMSGDQDHVVFSIDSLQDTNHIYRKGCRWENIMASATAFISAGGRAEWHFIAFAHNEHQIEEARALSQKMGFKKFAVKKTMRIPTEDIKIALPKRSELVHTDAVEKASTSLNEKFSNQCSISCQTKHSREIFVDFQGDLWPCCYLATRKIVGSSEEAKAVHRLFEAYGKNFLSLRHHSLDEILANEWYSQALEASWSLPTSHSHLGRQPTCVESCNTQFNNQNILSYSSLADRAP